MMNNRRNIHSDVEKGFSRYIQICLYHSSRDFFRKLDFEYRYTEPLNENIENVQLTINFFSAPIGQIEVQEYLSSVIKALNPMEKKLLAYKFYDEKTDSEIANLLGLTQQAVSKAKRLLLEKLKQQLEV
ncbi:sigma-70 family RNA polymerase sigma factor [Paenibacillus sp. FSL F4-0122]|uniref:sigma-70 family RNA polymerase sigma factor n=1 Tax=Paenibacillus TaxID=44249 RepID=UPI00159544D6|nr:sigma-70 family RNA polymerase sigma factor [Paenibacillus odorifer]